MLIAYSILLLPGIPRNIRSITPEITPEAALSNEFQLVCLLPDQRTNVFAKTLLRMVL